MAPRKRTFIDFRAHKPVVSIGEKSATLGNDNTTAALAFGSNSLELYYEQANADITGTRLVDANCTNGFEVPLDNTDADGIEITQGILADASAPYAFTIGTDGPFKFEVKLGIPNASDYHVAMGFRINAAYVADIANTTPATCASNMEAAYTDKAIFNFEGAGDGSATAADGHIITSNDNVDVDTDVAASWADDAVKTLTVKVSSAGAVTYEIDGTAVADAVAFSFDSTDVVIPFMRISRVAATADTPPILNYWYCGLY